jgi:hypothetical protein
VDKIWRNISRTKIRRELPVKTTKFEVNRRESCGRRTHLTLWLLLAVANVFFININVPQAWAQTGFPDHIELTHADANHTALSTEGAPLGNDVTWHVRVLDNQNPPNEVTQAPLNGVSGAGTTLRIKIRIGTTDVDTVDAGSDFTIHSQALGLPAGNYTVTASNDTGNVTLPDATHDLAFCLISSVSVINGATQTDMRQNYPATGNQNWGCVKAAGNHVEVQVTTTPDIAAAWNLIVWDNGEHVPNGAGGLKSNNYRWYSRDTSTKITVKPIIGEAGPPSLFIWVIWGTYTIYISGQTDADQICETQSINTFLKDGVWRADVGGSNHLGATDRCHNNTITYKYLIGRTQGVATLTPSGVGDIVEAPIIVPPGYHVWHMRRTVTIKAWDNGGHYVNETWQTGPSIDLSNFNDDSALFALDLTPTDTGGKDKLYDADPPAVPTATVEMHHTSETYVNFTAWAEIDLDATYRCTDKITYSYQGQVDFDAANPTTCAEVGLNSLSTSTITIPTSPHYAHR